MVRSFLLPLLLSGGLAQAQLDPTCMVVDGYFYLVSEAGFVQLADGGYASAGAISETNDGYNEIGITRFDADGALTWVRKWTMGPFKNIYPQALVATADGGMAVAGIDQTGSSYRRWFIAKFQADGELQWAKTYGGPDFNVIGSLNSEGFIQTSDGGFAAIAQRNEPNRAYCMLRTDADGDVLWSDEIRFTGVPADVAELPGGDLIFTGWKNGFSAPPLTVRKDGLTGETEWLRWHTSSTDEIDIHAAAVGADGTIVLAGRCYVPTPGEWGHLGVLALNPEGEPLWMTKVWTADDVTGFQITRHPEGGYVVVGRSSVAFPGTGEVAPTIARLSEQGDLLWSKRYPLTDDLVSSSFSRVDIAADGDLLVTGKAGTSTAYVQRLLKLAPDGSTCAYCTTQDSGSFRQLEPLLAADQPSMQAGAWANAEELELTMVDMTADVRSAACVPTAVVEQALPPRVQVYPDPLVDMATFQLALDPGSLQFELIDAAGRVVHSRSVTGRTFQLHRGDLRAGSYVYRLLKDDLPFATGTIRVADR
ncbi:MAG: T9SS type A sorting domain-containing protein [Flavobacteriales bacterium]